jgi:hypothetical protein
VLLGALYRVGWLAEAAEEKSRWRPMEFNGAVVSSLQSTLRGRGNGWAAPLQKGKWRRHRVGGGGGARCDGSRPDRWWRRVIGPEEGDEGGEGRVGCKGRVGQMTGWASFKNGKRKWSWVGVRETFGLNSNRATEKNGKVFFEFLFQGNGIQIQSFDYFQTKFELDSK